MDLFSIYIAGILISFCSCSSDNINGLNVETDPKDNNNMTWNDAILMIFSFIMIMLIVMFIVNCIYFVNEWYIKYQLRQSIKQLELQDFDETEAESEQIELLS